MTSSSLNVHLLVATAIIQAHLWNIYAASCHYHSDTKQPGQSQTLATCNSIGSNVSLTCQYCTCDPSQPLSPILWYFTQDCQKIGTNKLETNVTQIYNYVNEHKCNSTLTIPMGNSDTAGYYWCIATVADNPIPSQVVHIQVTNATILSQSNVSSSHSAEDKYKTISLTSVTCHNDDFKPPGTPIATDTPGTPINNTTEPSSTTTERKGSGGRFRTEIVWLAIGVVLALLLLGVVILLAIIAALRCKKRTLKAVSSPTHHSNAYTQPGEMGFVTSSQAAGQTDKTREIECEPEYEVIPDLRVVNPLFTSRENDNAPFSPTSVKYEDMSMAHLGDSQPLREQYEEVDLVDPPEYSRLERSVSVKNPSTSSTPDPHILLEIKNSITQEPRERIFDDPKYTLIESFPSRPDVPVHILKSTSFEENNLETSNPSMDICSSEYSRLEYSVNSKEIPSSSFPDLDSSPQSNTPAIEGVFDDSKYTFVGPRPHMPVQLSKSAPQDVHDYSETAEVFDKSHPMDVKNNRKFSYDSSTGSPHTHTQVLPKQSRKEKDNTFQIASTEDEYISEKGHIYHILENSIKSEKGGNHVGN